jgi:hypothetical protein
MLQQDAVVSQYSPVMRQPGSDRHTAVPLPRSRHCRVQQFDGPSQGVPPWPQPPGASRQRPTPPAVAEQRPEQQSSPPKQMSPGAWQ